MALNASLLLLATIDHHHLPVERATVAHQTPLPSRSAEATRDAIATIRQSVYNTRAHNENHDYNAWLATLVTIFHSALTMTGEVKRPRKAPRQRKKNGHDRRR